METGRKWIVEKFGGVENLRLVQFSVDELANNLKSDDVLIKVLSTTATYTDQLIIHGNYQGQPPLPCTPGYDCIGIITKLGSNVSQLKINDRVATMPQSGCMSTHIVVPSKFVYKVRDDISPSLEVSVVLTGVTSYQMIHREAGIYLTPEKVKTTKILVHACAGGTGAMIVNLLKIHGVPVENIYGTCSMKSMATAKELGIHIYDYTNTKQSWCNEILKHTNQDGVDIIFDSIMLQGYYKKNLRCLRSNGKYIAYGITNTSKPGSLPLFSVLFTFFRMWFHNTFISCFNGKKTIFYSVADYHTKYPNYFGEDLSKLVDLVSTNTLSPVIGKIWSFDEANKALESIEKNTHTGKQIIDVFSPETIV